MADGSDMLEEEFRRLLFIVSETHKSESGETDIFSSDMADGPEIHVDLRPDRGGRLSFHEISVTSGDGGPISILDDRGREIETELVEVLAWEMIEDFDQVLGYMEGRCPMTRADGTPARVGEALRYESELEGCAMAGP